MARTSDKDSVLLHFNEAYIINALHKGEERMFNAIYKEYAARLYQFCTQFIDDKQHAEDIVTESFVQLWKQHGDFHSLNDIRGFLYVTAKNFCYSALRDKKRRNKHHQRILHTLETAQDSILTYIVKAEHRRELHQAIALLPDRRRHIVKEMIDNGATVRELAIALNISEQTVYSAMEKAIKSLKETLDKGTGLTIIIVLYILLNIIELAKRVLLF
jgi:RNA polymerase sigma-70 factor (ECF subfamily)